MIIALEYGAAMTGFVVARQQRKPSSPDLIAAIM
jgi:hypothetical protein